MKAILIIPVFNRPEYVKQCFESLKKSDLSLIFGVIIIDDCSTDKETIQLVDDLVNTYTNVVCARANVNKGIKEALMYGYELAFSNGADVVINLDSDAIVRNDWVRFLLALDWQDNIVTGFNCHTKNRDGSDRHKVTFENSFSNHKASVGGINMAVSKQTYVNHIRPALLGPGNWDHNACLSAGGAICTVPSVIQHIGFNSSLGHNEPPDVADDFKPLSLTDVTLVCIDDDMARCKGAIDASTKYIHFEAVKLITDLNLGSKEAYSNFVINELYKHIDTAYCLIIQHDGYVKNWQAWSNEFYKYDYIGACWWYNDGKNVGNGGFSLRSHKLLKLTADLDLKVTHPEDQVICRDNREFLESQGIVFAPDEVAKRFSFEGYMQHGKYSNEFGFHGFRALVEPKRIIPGQRGYIINQFLGLGDILFLIPLIRKWMSEGHDVIWPIADEYLSIKKHFPDIQFVPKDAIGINFEARKDYYYNWTYGRYEVKSLRWNMARTPGEAMTSKYSMYGEDFNIFRSLSFLPVNPVPVPDMDYDLICEDFGNVTDGGADVKSINIVTTRPVMRLKKLDGHTLLDWADVIKNAVNIHAVSSSSLYLFESMELRAKEIHLYSRRLGQRDIDHILPLLTKKYIFHV